MTNVIFQDTQHLVEVLFQILFYLTPIMYPAKLLAERRIGLADEVQSPGGVSRTGSGADPGRPDSLLAAYATALTTVVVCSGAGASRCSVGWSDD